MKKFPPVLFLSLIFLAGTALSGETLFPPIAPDVSRNGYVNDEQIFQHVEQELRRIIDGGKFTSTSTLIEQLGQRRICEIKNLPKPRTTSLQPGEIYRQNLASCLLVASTFKCPKCNNWHFNHAGATVLTEDGVAVTNFHVMNNRESPTMAAITSGGKLYPIVEVLAASEADDIAIIRLDTHGDKLSPVPVEAVTPVGSGVTLISSPEGRFFTLSTGIVSRYFMERDHNRQVPRVAMTADYAKGSSGSPLFNERGNVAGLVATTHSIYYDVKNNVERNLQMVVKSCVPAESVLKLIKP